jgi:hypothetical protein
MGGTQTGTIAQIVNGSPMHGGMARDLLVVLGVAAWIAATAVAAMTAIATDAVAGPVLLAGTGLMGVLAIVPGMLGGRRARERRRLLRRVGEPAALAGTWRRMLAAAWSAREAYAGVVDDLAGSPLGDHVGGSRHTVDAGLERCGVLAREGDRLARLLRGSRVRTLRRDLRAEQRRDPHGERARTLAARLAEVERLAAAIDHVQRRLEASVHDLQTAAWRAAELRTASAVDVDATLDDLLADLAHLRAALDEVDRPAPSASADPWAADRAAGSAPWEAPDVSDRDTTGGQATHATGPPRRDLGAQAARSGVPVRRGGAPARRGGLG